MSSADALLRLGRRDEAVRVIETMQKHAAGFPAQLMAAAAMSALGQPPALIRTVHETALAFDLVKREVIHSPPAYSTTALPLYMELSGSLARLCIRFGGTTVFMAADRSGSVTNLPSDPGAEFPSRFEIGAGPDGTFTIRCGSRYLSAEPGGRVLCNRRSADQWESFRFFSHLGYVRTVPLPSSIRTSSAE